MMDESGIEQGRRRRRWRAPVLATTGVVALALGGLWIARAPIAEDLIDRELAARDVRARYRITSIGPRTQRIEDVVLGDPAHPDLVARWIEVDIGIAGLSPSVAAVRAGGVRLAARYQRGRLSLGELDKFMGQGGSTTSALPDIALGLSDARAAVATDYGGLGLVLDGAGNLRDGFRGRGVAAMPRMSADGCEGRGLIATIAIHMAGGRPRLSGPVRATALGCPASGLLLAAPRVDVDARIGTGLDSVEGSARLSAAAAQAAGVRLGRPGGSLSLRAGVRRFGGKARIGIASLAGFGGGAGRGLLDLRFNGESARALAADGTLALDDLSGGRDPLAATARAVAGTPVAPLAAKLAKAVRDASGRNRLTTAFALKRADPSWSAALSDLHFASASGARIHMSDGGRLGVATNGGWDLAGALSLGGGGLPDARLSLVQRAGGVSGELTMQPYAASGARLAFTPVRFTLGRNGAARFDTVATIDGPLADGGVRGLVLPLSGGRGGDGTLSLNPRCAPIRWHSLRVSTLALDPAALTLCPAEGGAMLRQGPGGLSGGVRVTPMALTGRIGESPLRLTAADLIASLTRPGFRAAGLEARIGPKDAPVILAAQTLDGALAGGTLSGAFARGHGRIGAVPFDLTDLDGRWRFARGRLDVDGALRVSDTAAAPRFKPLVVRDAHLALAGGRIAATGHLRHPTQGDAFAAVTIAHDLSTGEGDARIALQDMRFGKALQPDDLTPLAEGVVANVDGPLTGEGAIHWTRSGVTSTGTFATPGMNLAAAFGPVQGLATTLHFTDLLAMETAPGQVATMASVNPGVEVRDGRVHFQLLPNARARIEDGEWPFAGGRLTLLPSTLDFDVKGARNLIFRVTGLEAGAFIQTMELKNLSATGTFDGLLPIIFDAQGGRITGGILVARQAGLPPLVVENAANLTVRCDPLRQSGTLSYVGEVSNAQMGAYGKMAFDALKRLRYKCLTILLDGALDGEFVTRIAINGVNQGTEESRRSMLLRPFLGLPFLFNVRIEAPFRGLLNTYQSFVDPTALVRENLGPQYRTVLENKLAVQPSDSDNGASRKGE